MASDLLSGLIAIRIAHGLHQSYLKYFCLYCLEILLFILLTFPSESLLGGKMMWLLQFCGFTGDLRGQEESADEGGDSWQNVQLSSL